VGWPNSKDILPSCPQNMMDILEEKCPWENSDEDGTNMLGWIL